MKKIMCFVLAWMFAAGIVYAADEKYDIGEIVVTADRFEESSGETGNSVSVIYDEDIQEKGDIVVSDELRSVPGLNVVRNGGLGGYTSVYIRGAESYHTLVMIDGVEMNDPISATRLFDWAHLMTDDIERIEVLRGPSSTLYGSDAMGGVVNIITKQGEGKPSIGGLLEGGSYETFKESIYSKGGVLKGDYSVSLSHISSEGYSIAKGGSEKDGYENTSFMGKFGYNITEKFRPYVTWRYMQARNDFDDEACDDDPNYNGNTMNFSGKAGIEHSVKDWWKYDLNFSWLNTKNNYWDPTDVFEPIDYTKAWYDGTDYKGTWQNTIEMGEISTLVGGVEYQREQGKSFSEVASFFGDFIDEFPKKTADTVGVFLQDTIRLWERLIVTVGARYEEHEISKDHFDYKLSATYTLPKIDTRLKGSIGTGFKAPSLFQLYSIYGSTDLKPEEVRSFDIGFEQPLFDAKIILCSTYFYSDFSDLIDWDDALWQYRNVSKAVTNGVENEIDWVVCKQLKAGLTYTYLETEDKSTGMELDRRPKNTFGAAISWYPTEKITARADLSYVGKRKDVNYTVFPYEQINLDSYTKIDLSLHYKILKNCEIFGRVENLLDEDYEEVYGFNSPRISGYGGVKLDF